MHIYLSTNHLVTDLFQLLSIQFLCSFISYCSRASCDSQTTAMENNKEWLSSSCRDSPVPQTAGPLLIVFALIYLFSVVEAWGWLF